MPEQAGKHPPKRRLGTNDKHPLVRPLGYHYLGDGVLKLAFGAERERARALTPARGAERERAVEPKVT